LNRWPPRTQSKCNNASENCRPELGVTKNGAKDGQDRRMRVIPARFNDHAEQ
jgi:hypothetical protein